MWPGAIPAHVPITINTQWLVRFLQEKTFRRVGGTKDITVDVRIIAATNRDLVKAVKDGQFREDLNYRLNVIPINLPPLRERKEDIPVLVKSFIDTFNQEFKKSTRGVSDGALERLIAYSWPGNVRELRNVIERVMILENKHEITVEDLPREIRDPSNSIRVSVPDGFRLPDAGFPLKDIEQEMVQQALDKTRRNQTRAAKLLNISRDALRYKMKKYGIL